MYKTVYTVIGKQAVLPFYLTGIGISEPEFHVKRDTGLVSHQFLFTKSGKGCLIVDGCSYIQNAGSIFYLSPEVPHEYYAVGDEWTTCWFVFRGEHASELMSIMGFSPWMTADDINSHAIMNIFNVMLTTADNSAVGNAYSAEKCSQLIYEFILNARLIFLAEYSKLPHEHNIIDNAVVYINEHFSDDITLDKLAETAKISPQHFCRLFKAREGMRPLEYIARRRISEAKSLLYSTDYSISHIGELCGYPDITYFGMVFRKYEGISPSQYKRTINSLPL